MLEETATIRTRTGFTSGELTERLNQDLERRKPEGVGSRVTPLTRLEDYTKSGRVVKIAPPAVSGLRSEPSDSRNVKSYRLASSKPPLIGAMPGRAHSSHIVSTIP